MGTVNYGSSDYITIGLMPISSWDIEHNPELLQDLQDSADENGTSLEDEMEFYVEDISTFAYNYVERIRDKYEFDYFKIEIKSGYYEGFYIDIESNLDYCFDDWTEKGTAQKEVTQIKRFLIECADFGLVQVFPDWITTYKTYTETMQAISAAIKAMRADIRITPTWAQYKRETRCTA